MTDFEVLVQAVEDFCIFIVGLPQASLVERTWGPKEVLAHLLYLHEIYTQQARGLLAGEAVEIPQGRYSDLNALAVERSRSVPIQELIERFRIANQQLGALYVECSPEQVRVPIKAGVRSYTLTELVPELEVHVRNHQRKLEKELRQAKAR